MNGDTIWTNKFGEVGYLDFGNDVLESISGNYLIAGETQSFGVVNSDGIIVKISPSGIENGTLFTGVSGYDNIKSIAEDTLGRVAMTGEMKNAMSFDVSLFIVKSNWGFFSGTSFGFSGFETGNSIEPTADKGFIICGYSDSYNNHLADVYLIKVDSTGFSTTTDQIVTVNVEDFSTNNNEFNVYPNPANVEIYILFDKLNKPATIKIYDVIGKEIKSEVYYPHQTSTFSISTSDISEGIYLINIISEEKTFSKKLIIQH
jgi:hypothetical protein